MQFAVYAQTVLWQSGFCCPSLPQQIRTILGEWSANRKLAQVDSMSTIRIRLGHESLDVTLAYLKGKDAESEEAQERANSSSLALYA